MNSNRKRMIAAGAFAFAAAVIIAAFVLSSDPSAGNDPSVSEITTESAVEVSADDSDEAEKNAEASGEDVNADAAEQQKPADEKADVKKEDSSDKAKETAVSEKAAAAGSSSGGGGESKETAKPAPEKETTATKTEGEFECTISVSCATILDNMDRLKSGRESLVPSDGWIIKPVSVTFYEGENVFNVLQRTCKANGVHMEFVNTPGYGSVYIEGINNLYEFDCGELSGWNYKVNGVFPNYGCSKYALKDGDMIEWVFTCERGADVGANNVSG